MPHVTPLKDVGTRSALQKITQIVFVTAIFISSAARATLVLEAIKEQPCQHL
jgi:hypothetical protein